MATPRAGVIPTSIKDETGAIARQQAEANDRMAQLFYTLLAKREDRLFAAQQREQAAADADRRWYERFDYSQSAKNNPQDNRPSTPGAQPNVVGDDNAAPSGGGATTPTMKGAPAILDHRRFSTNTSAPANVQTADAGYDGPTDVSASARSSYAQASPQQLQETKASNKVSAAGGNAKRTPSTSLPRVSNRRPAPQVMFRGVTPEVRAAWEDAEQKNGLPRGQLLFTYGLESDGGRLLGNADGTGPQGPFQWTPALLREKGLTVHDAQDLIKMGYHTARNMAENHQQLVKRTTAGGQAIQLSNDAGDMPSWHILHQWGRSSGPNIVAAGKLNAGMPLVTQLPKQVKRRDGTMGGPGEWLSANGIHNPDATIAHEYARIEKRGAPYRTAALTGVGFPDASAPTTSQGTPAGPQVAGGQEPPRPPADVPNAGVQGRSLGSYLRGKPPEHVTGLGQVMQQRLQALFDAAPPEIRNALGIISGYRSKERQAQLWNDALRKYGSAAAARKWVAPPGGSEHGRGNATDLHYGTPAARQWVHNNARQFGLKFPLGHEPWHVEVAETRGGPKFAGQLPQRPAAPATAAKPAAPTEASAQRRGPIDKYEYTENLPSEGKRDVTMDFRGPTSYAQRSGGAPAAPDTAQAKPTPTPQQQPAPSVLPPSFTPTQPQVTPTERWPGVQQQAPQQYTPYTPDPTTVPQDLPFEANYPAPPTVDMPMPRPRPADMQSVATQALQQRAELQPDDSGSRTDPRFMGGSQVDPGFERFGAQMPPLDVPMPRARPQSGAQSVDEAGFIPEMAVPQGNEYAPDAMAMPAGNEYAPDAMAMPAGNEYAPPPPPVMAVPEGNEYAADVMATPEGNEFETPNMAAAPGNEFAPPPKLPGANLTMPTKPFSMQERRMGAQAPPQPLPADYMTLQQRIGWPSGEERFKMQNKVRDALFDTMKQPFNAGTDAANVGGMPEAPPFDASKNYPPVADIPLPPEGGGEGGPPPQTRDVADAIFGSNKPNPMHGIAKPYVDSVLQTIRAKAKEYQQRAQAIPPPQMSATSTISLAPQAPPPLEQDLAPVVTPQQLMDFVKGGVRHSVPGRVAEGGYNAISNLFANRNKAAPPAEAQAAPPAGPAFQPRKVKVQNIGPGGQPVLPDGEPITIPNPNPGRSTIANTPLPPFAQQGGTAPKPGGIPPPPQVGAGAKPAAGFRKWKTPDGRTITTKPGEEPPPGSQPVQ